MDAPEYTTITGISDHGTIVCVHLADHPRPIYFDHRPFGWMWDARGGRAGLIGARVRRVNVTLTSDDTPLDELFTVSQAESILFEDEE